MSTLRLHRFFMAAIMLTACTLIYVHQNIEITKIGYNINDKQKVLSYFLDQQKRLVYNLNQLQSPSALNERLYAESIELVETDSSNIYYAGVKEEIKIAKRGRGQGRIIDRILDTFTEKAEAKVSE